MSFTAWVLAGLTALAGALCLAALLDEWHEPRPKRVAQHGRWVGEGATTRLSSIEPPTEVIKDARCACLHRIHATQCRAPLCACLGQG